MASPKTKVVLIEFRIQGNGTLTFREPSGDIFVYQEEEGLENFGRRLIEVLRDSEASPQSASVPKPKDVPGDDPAPVRTKAEDHVRGLLNSFLPGGEGILDAVQKMSED